ncbi:site-specific integrase [Comamonas sp. E6]|uniref:site-specific integrase n=1 Tax=Comamonas sp. E6 TaxID=364029 RepID=UPI000ADCC958|nr:site-specific integrase [Comamonas sp. E6]
MDQIYRRPSGIYAVRMYVPKRLQSIVGKTELHFSTGSRKPVVSKIIAADIRARWHRTLHQLSFMDSEKIKEALPELLSTGYIKLPELASLLGSDITEISRMMCDRNYPFYIHSERLEGWIIDDLEQDIGLGYYGEEVEVAIVPQMLTTRFGITRPTGFIKFYFEDDVRELVYSNAESHGARVFQIATNSRYFVVSGDDVKFRLRDAWVRRTDAQHFRFELLEKVRKIEAVIGVKKRDEGPKVETVVVDESIRLSKLIEQYFSVKVASSSWKFDQQDRRRKQADILLGLIGDVPSKGISRNDLRLFKSQLEHIPYRRDLLPKKLDLREASIKELMDIAKAKKLKCITSNEQKKILDGACSIFKWALNEGLLEKNPAAGLSEEIVVKRKRAQDERCALTDEMLLQVFGLEWFRDGKGHRTAAGRYHSYSPHYYWLPVIGLFSGARLNEICQLALSDIVDINGVWCFHVTNEDDDGNKVDDKDLKTSNAKRLIPVHPELLRLGLKDYCDALMSAGYERLFPELKFHAVKGYSKDAGKWFNDRVMLGKLNIPRDGKYTFHSLRHNFAAALSKTGIVSSMKADLMGHERSDLISEVRYEKAASVNDLKPYIDLMRFEIPVICEFNVAEGMMALKDALRRKIDKK